MSPLGGGIDIHAPNQGMNDPEDFLLQLAEATAAGIVRWERLSRGVWGSGKTDRTVMYRPGAEAYLLVAGNDGRQTLSLPPSDGTRALDLILREREGEAEALKLGVGAALCKAGIEGVDDAIDRAIGETESGRLRWKFTPLGLTADMRVSLLARVRFDVAFGSTAAVTMHRPWSEGGPTFTRSAHIWSSPPARLADLAFTSALSMRK